MVFLIYPVKNKVNWKLNIKKKEDKKQNYCFILILNLDNLNISFKKVISTSIYSEITYNKFISKKQVKTQSYVSGSKRKLYAQKGTGKSRIGSKVSSIQRGGGIIFGPKVREFNIKSNKNLWKLAYVSLIILKKHNILVIEGTLQQQKLIYCIKNYYDIQLQLIGISNYDKILGIFFEKGSIFTKYKTNIFLSFTIKYLDQIQCIDLLLHDYLFLYI